MRILSFVKRTCIALLGLAAVCAHADLIYTFDSDNQGWRRSNFNQATLVLTDVGPATWNAGGFIDADDFADWSFHTSPILSGSFAGSASISFDFSTEVTDGQGYPFIVMASLTGAIFQAPVLPGDGAFHHYDFDLTSATNWTYGDVLGFRPATNADVQSVLSGLKVIGINADIVNGADYTRVDNVRLSAVPEPATMAALGLGIAALMRRRSRSK